MNIYEKLSSARITLQKKLIKKSGFNKFANFQYFTLEDFLPIVQVINSELKMLSVFTLDKEKGVLKIVNCEGDDFIEFTTPIADADIKGSTPVQCLGGVHTYLKRYLYLNAYEIVEGEMLDALVGTDKLVTNKKQDPELIKRLEELGGSLEIIKSLYKHNSVEEITNEEIKDVIARKEKQLNKSYDNTLKEIFK